MRQGSAVHKTLEDEVHRTIAIDVKTKEDAWGLRIWNVIQGLRTLRATGMTRELEIWGIIDGLVVNGVIDELSYVCPDRELESTILSGKQDSTASLPPDQRTITEFLSPHGSSNLNAGNHGSRSQPQASESASLSGQRVYITDTKTRSSTSLPKGASLRPTIMQLMLYHRLLYNLSTGNIDPDTLFSRYQLDAHSPFTDAFAAQIGEIEDEVFYDAPDSTQSHDAESEPDAPAPRENQGDGLSLLLAHNSLHRLFFLLLSEFRTTFPLGTESISNILTASYRSTSDGEVIGQRTFLMDEKVLGEYLEEELRWWRGEREAKGVSVEEAYKCGYCEFAEGCDWRKGKVEEARERARLRGKRRKSVI